jgi:hypothetical protein
MHENVVGPRVNDGWDQPNVLIVCRNFSCYKSDVTERRLTVSCNRCYAIPEKMVCQMSAHSNMMSVVPVSDVPLTVCRM